MSATAVGDMPIGEFRAAAHQLADWMADYLATVESRPVLSRCRPGDVRGTQNVVPPAEGQQLAEILEDFGASIIPGITHWNHPAFFGYFGISGSGPGILGEMLTAALNVNGMLWQASPAATEIEEVALGWLGEMIGLPSEFSGHIQDTASTSTMVALGTAREAAGFDIRAEGLAGRDLPRLRVYCSTEAHSSIERAAITLGIGANNVRRVGTDAEFRMDVAALEEAIAADMTAGYRPLCVVATLGTTSTTSVDPIDQIADLCQRHGLWLHVDGAYGGAAGLLPEMRQFTRGWERANSIVVNPHKWLFVPLDCSVLYLRDPLLTRHAFSQSAAYLKTAADHSVVNLMELGPALGRRFRALKLWMVLRYFGHRGLADRLRGHLRMASALAQSVDREPGWRVVAPVHFSVVCFRYEPGGVPVSALDGLNQRILEKVNESGEMFISPTRLNGEFTLRLAIGNIRTEQRHVDRAWGLLRSVAAEL